MAATHFCTDLGADDGNNVAVVVEEAVIIDDWRCCWSSNGGFDCDDVGGDDDGSSLRFVRFNPILIHSRRDNRIFTACRTLRSFPHSLSNL